MKLADVHCVEFSQKSVAFGWNSKKVGSMRLGDRTSGNALRPFRVPIWLYQLVTLPHTSYLAF
jgi:hypothetical protein